MTVTVEVAPEFRRAFKMRLLERGFTAQDLVTWLLSAWLEGDYGEEGSNEMEDLAHRLAPHGLDRLPKSRGSG
ncbi:hypothetical protein [Azospirillum sp. B4]|uniref:hypothetical protein n=1 Tax=Azospirillum sp. B4 TaxID=95605 RepID=UPI0011DD641F|nr:hypothetical protein [Azospirillum sp. B4]